jgi:hypothetical protein
MKRCPDCLQYKPLDEFPRNRRTKSGYATYCKPCHNARGTETRTRLYGSSRHYHLKRRYGIGAVDVEELIRQQGGVCPICDKPGPEHVDHDHVTGRIRGILCFNCNGGLGQFGDDSQRLYRAALYVEDAEQRPGEINKLTGLARERAYALRESAA